MRAFRLLATLGTTRRSDGIAVMRQQWLQLLFLHWLVAPHALQLLIPRSLTVDTFQGMAYVGLVAFTIRGVRMISLPPLSPVSDFHEVNLRTYVRREERDPGVWFFSLDAASRRAVIGARAWYGLAYHFARIRMEVKENTARGDCSVHYQSERLWPGPTHAGCALRYRITDPATRIAEPASLEHFLVERYLLYAGAEGRLRAASVSHDPYPIQNVEVDSVNETLTAAARLPTLLGPPFALYSPGVSVRVFGPRLVGR
jgi:uncharacterized protein